MAEARTGQSRVLRNRRYDDYASMKQHFNNRKIDEVIISGWGTTGAAVEFEFASETTDYAGAGAQAYIRCEADDANQDNKYVYLQYQTTTGAVQDWVTADISDAPDSTTEVAIGSTDFYRVRQMYSEVESKSAGGSMITLTDADMGGGDNWAYLEDGNSTFSLQRFFTQPSATCRSFLGRITVQFPFMTAAATAVDAVLMVMAYTPKAHVADGSTYADGGAEVGVAANMTLDLRMNGPMVIEPLIELAPATEVSFTWADTTTPQVIWFEAIMLEVYEKSQPSA